MAEVGWTGKEKLVLDFSAVDLGLLLSAGLASIGYFYRTGADRREKARKLLFYLFEIRHELRINRPRLDEAVQEMQDELRTLIGNRPSFLPMVENLPKDQLGAMLGAMVEGITRVDANLLQGYEDALTNFAKVDPLLSYKVRGMKLLPMLSENAETALRLYQQLPELNSSEEAQKHIVDFGKRKLGSSFDQTKSELMEMLEKAILAVSRKAGFFIRFRTSRLLREPLSSDDDEKIDLKAFFLELLRTILLGENKGEQLPNDVRDAIHKASLEELLDLVEQGLAEKAVVQ